MDYTLIASAIRDAAIFGYLAGLVTGLALFWVVKR